MNHCVLGFNGERRDTINGSTHLGNGYREFNPMLMCFHSPDSLSPSGGGGINSYTYCGGDPINNTDPNGHYSVGSWLGIGVAMALGMLLTPISGGSSLAAVLSVVSVTTAVASAALTVSQTFLAERDPKTAAVLGWAALGMGIVSALSSVALTRMVPGVKSLVSLLRGSSNRPIGGMMLQSSTVSRQMAQPSGQFRNPLFLGIYPAEGNEGFYMALRFTDRFAGHERLNIVGTAAMNPRNNFAMGSGRWIGRSYERVYLGARTLSTNIRGSVAGNPEIRTVRLAVPYAARGIGRTGTLRTNVQWYLWNSGTNVEVTAPYGEYSTHGPAAGAINAVLDGLYSDRFDGLYTAGGQPFDPVTAQELLNTISGQYADTPNAFHINFNPAD